jgi:hypothetical protein
MLFRPAACLLLLGAWPVVAGASEAGRIPIQHFTQRDFEGHNQVFDLGQSADGVMYFTNRGALLEYDGTVWRRAAVPTTWIRKLHLTTSGRIYLAGTDELGYAEHDEQGVLTYHSLLPHLPPELRQTGAVWSVEGHRDAVYFSTNTHVFRWRDETFTVWPMPAAGRSNFFTAQGRFYHHRGGDGLYRLADDGSGFVAVNREEPVVTNSRISLLDDPAGDPVIATLDGRLFFYRDDRLVPWEAPAAGWMRQAGAVFALRLADGRLAVSTLQRGVALLSRDGRLLQIFDRETGLDSPQFYKLLEDR